ncbi:MAG: cytochrome C oxidase subunit IV family protein [Pyrinomonadaceae bacterium]
MSEHIVSIRTYVVIFSILTVGTALTVWAGQRDFPGPLNVVIALTIACIKATFVVLYFMHVRYSSRLVWVIVGSALFWLAILFALTFSDYWTRNWLTPFSSSAIPQEPTASYREPPQHARKLGIPT